MRTSLIAAAAAVLGSISIAKLRSHPAAAHHWGSGRTRSAPFCGKRGTARRTLRWLHDERVRAGQIGYRALQQIGVDAETVYN